MSNTLTGNIIELLKLNPDSDLIVAVGNSFRFDDGVGPYIAGELEKIIGLKVINAGYTPENIIEEVISLGPKKILIIDAADWGGNPGEVRIIPEDKIPQTTLSTHAIPLNVITGIICQSIKTRVFFIGIQPKSVCFGEGLSGEIKKTADEIVEIIRRNMLK
ncbi:MAG: hydrogenase maturation peptidase HycI [Candidatus Omnitrophota bacterium]